MKPAHAIALLLIPVLSVAGAVLATWSRTVRDVLFFLIVSLAVLAERIDVNFFSEAWYRGTTRGVQISLPEICAFALLIGCWLGRQENAPRRYWPASLGLMLLSLVYACVSVATSQPKLFGAFELSKIAGGILIFLAAAMYLRTPREWTILLVALGGVVAFEGLWAVKQKFLTHLDRVAGTLDHPNSLSMYFCMATPPLVAAAYSGWNRAVRWVGAAGAALATLGIMLTVSRAGIPIFATVTLGTLAACASWKLTLRTVILRVGLAGACIALVAGLWSQMSRRYAEATLREEYLDAHVDGRGIYLRLAANIARDHFFGVGLNNWSYHVSRTYGPQLGFPFEDYDYLVAVYGTSDVPRVFGDAYLAAPAHNLAALTLGELGVPGLLIFFLLWLRWFSMGLPFLFLPRGDPMRTMGVGLFFSVCGIFGQSLTEWVFRQTPILLTFHVLLGALAALVLRRKEPRRPIRSTATARPLVATEEALTLQAT